MVWFFVNAATSTMVAWYAPPSCAVAPQMGIEALTEVLISTHAPSKAEPCNPAQLRVHAPAKTPRQGLSRTPLAHAARPGRLALACRSAALQMVVGSARQRKAKGLTFHLFSRCFLAPTRVPVSCCCTVCTRGSSTVTKPRQAKPSEHQPERKGVLWHLDDKDLSMYQR